MLGSQLCRLLRTRKKHSQYLQTPHRTATWRVRLVAMQGTLSLAAWLPARTVYGYRGMPVHTAVHTCRKCMQRVKLVSSILTVCVCRRTCAWFGLSVSEACVVLVDSRTSHPFSVSRPQQDLFRGTCYFEVAADTFGPEQGSGAQAAGRNILI